MIHVPEVRFTINDFAKVFASATVLIFGITFFAQFFPISNAHFGDVHPSITFILQYAVQSIALFLPLAVFVLAKYSPSFSDFGFKKAPLARILKVALGAYFFYITISILVLSFLAVLDLKVPGFEEQESYLPMFGTDLTGLFVGGLFLILIGPFLEELLFRGFVYRVFAKTWKIFFASIMSAILFALLHFQIENIVQLIFLGVILNFVYQYTGTVWASFAFHCINNSIAFAVKLLFFINPNILNELERLSVLEYNSTMLTISAFMPW